MNYRHRQKTKSFTNQSRLVIDSFSLFCIMFIVLTIIIDEFVLVSMLTKNIRDPLDPQYLH